MSILMHNIVHKVKQFIKKETVLIAAWVLAVISMFIVPPNEGYLAYIDIRSLGILWGLMVVMQGLKKNGLFEYIGLKLLAHTKHWWQLSAVLVFLCFFSGMLITNDVALITFVPFGILMLKKVHQEQMMIPVIVLQTIAANLGSMLTPIGNPQNLYLYGLSGMTLPQFLLNMLPYTLLSAVLLIAMLALLSVYRQRKSTAPLQEKSGDELPETKAIWGPKVIIYLLLFVLAILVVLRVLPYPVLVGVVFLVVLFMERKVLLQVDYALLLTFVGFFIFTGNMGQLPAVYDTLQSIVAGREIPVAILTSQCISNVPAALLLSGFTTNYKALLIGVNLGGLGTLIASMASLISYKIYANDCGGNRRKYILCFTAANILFLIVLILFAYAVN